MLPNHSPLVIAEQFGTLASLYPGRIDLGLGRAPGSDQTTARALRRNLMGGDEFPQDVVELMQYFESDPPGPVRAVPGAGLDVPIWILAPQSMMQAIDIYRSTFRPSDKLEAPYVMLGFNVFAADTDEEARVLATSQMQAFVNLRSGRPKPLPPPDAGYPNRLLPQEKAIIDGALSCIAIGAPDSVRQQVEAFVARTGANELMVTSQIFDHRARVRSYELLASEALAMAA
jgi:alkanesulfonate monooxygenase SsuD/methylene tetrahydromethanopterin reductase-like flavin-dependent oxidoreductase (luciferase family)